MTEALKLWVYFGDSQLTRTDLTSDALMDALARRHVAVSALCRGIEGFGLGRRIHTERFPDVSTDLPLVACAVDSSERIQALLDDVDGVVADGLVTLEYARLSSGEEVADAEFPSQPGRAAKLTIYCGRLERAAVGRRPRVPGGGGGTPPARCRGRDGATRRRRDLPRLAQARDLPLAQT
jgi:uncharacterized protein